MTETEAEKRERWNGSKPSWPVQKRKPCLKDVQSGETVVLGEIDGPGVIDHIWITVDNKPQKVIVLY